MVVYGAQITWLWIVLCLYVCDTPRTQTHTCEHPRKHKRMHTCTHIHACMITHAPIDTHALALFDNTQENVPNCSSCVVLNMNRTFPLSHKQRALGIGKSTDVKDFFRSWWRSFQFIQTEFQSSDLSLSSAFFHFPEISNTHHCYIDKWGRGQGVRGLLIFGPSGFRTSSNSVLKLSAHTRGLQSVHHNFSSKVIKLYLSSTFS